MKKNALIFIIFTMIITLVSFLPTNASADEVSNTTEDGVVSNIEIEQPVGNDTAVVDFVDDNLFDDASYGTTTLPGSGGPITTGPVSATGRITYKYAYSYYVVGSKTIQQYNVGPTTNSTALLSVARGESKKLDKEITVSGSVTYGGSVSADLKKLINLSLTSSVTGSVSFKYTTSITYKGPASPYNTRIYYGAIGYDLYSVAVKKYDVYNEYSGSVRIGTVESYAGTTYINSVKSPIKLSYSMDFKVQ